MKVLVDTCIWSLALRRKKHALDPPASGATNELAELIREGRASMIGPIRQELLSGITHEQQYAVLQARLRAFIDEPLGTPDYEEAARMRNRCRAAGLAGSPVDFLICSTAALRGWQIFTSDVDFRHFAKHVAVSLYRPRGPVANTR